MTAVIAVLVRAGALGAGLALLTVLPVASEDALGLGLLAFAAVVVVSGAWALVDGYRHGTARSLGWWCGVAVVVAVGWWIGFAATQRDASMSFTDLLISDAGFLPFVIVLVLLPAAVGAAVGGVVGRARKAR